MDLTTTPQPEDQTYCEETSGRPRMWKQYQHTKYKFCIDIGNAPIDRVSLPPRPKNRSMAADAAYKYMQTNIYTSNGLGSKLTQN